MVTSISREIDSDECVVRGIFHSLHVRSDGKIKREALLPPPGSGDVSLIRSQWIGATEIKGLIKRISIPNQIYFGVALVSVNKIKERVSLFENSYKNIHIIATPLPREKDTNTEGNIILKDFDNPYHADMCYPEPYPNVVA